MADSIQEYERAEQAYVEALRASAEDPTNDEKIVECSRRYQGLEIAYLEAFHGGGK